MPVRFPQTRLTIRLFALMSCLGSGALANDWQGLVIGDTGGGAAQAFADAYYASAAMKAWTAQAPVLLRNADHSSTVAALQDLTGSKQVVLYFAGPVQDDGQMLTDGQALALQEELAALTDAGLTHLLLLVENCTRYDSTAFPLPDLPEQPGLALAVVSSAAEGKQCPTAGSRLSDDLKRAAKAGGASPAEVLQSHLDAGILEELHGLGVVSAQKEPAAQAVKPVRQAQPADVVQLIPARTQAPAVVPVRTLAPADGQVGSFQQDQVALFLPQPSARIAAQPQPAGLPEPSIIIGVIREEDAASFPNAQNAPGSDIAYDDLEGRRRLRLSDPDLFGSLVAAGGFDPPSELLAQSLQTELARMGCYTSRIDGDWGPGSQAAARRYFQARGDGQSPPLQQASAELFRLVIGQDDVTCARPVAAAPTSNRNTINTRPAQSAPSAPAPTREPANTIEPGNTLGGVFR